MQFSMATDFSKIIIVILSLIGTESYNRQDTCVLVVLLIHLHSGSLSNKHHYWHTYFSGSVGLNYSTDFSCMQNFVCPLELNCVVGYTGIGVSPKKHFGNENSFICSKIVTYLVSWYFVAFKINFRLLTHWNWNALHFFSKICHCFSKPFLGSNIIKLSLVFSLYCP